MKKALIVVDVQYDFLPTSGALAVPGGDEVIGPIIEACEYFDTIIFTQDWHPANHCSFKENGGPWPAHCVQWSNGALLESNVGRQAEAPTTLKAGRDMHGHNAISIVQKGFHADVDSYSGFWDNERRYKTELDDILKRNKIDTLFICGLATDYCVKFTALDAVELGYKVYLLEDACRGVNVKPNDAKNAISQMEKKGVEILTDGISILKSLVPADIYKMKLHDRVLLPGINNRSDEWIMRVPGGWIYYIMDSFVYVPFDNEFAGHGLEY